MVTSQCQVLPLISVPTQLLSGTSLGGRHIALGGAMSEAVHSEQTRTAAVVLLCIVPASDLLTRFSLAYFCLHSLTLLLLRVFTTYIGK